MVRILRFFDCKNKKIKIVNMMLKRILKCVAKYSYDGKEQRIEKNEKEKVEC